VKPTKFLIDKAIGIYFSVSIVHYVRPIYIYFASLPPPTLFPARR